MCCCSVYVFLLIVGSFVRANTDVSFVSLSDQSISGSRRWASLVTNDATIAHRCMDHADLNCLFDCPLL